MTQLLTTRQVAAMLQVSPETVLRRWRAGEIPGYRLATNCLRFDQGQVVAWLEARGGQGEGQPESSGADRTNA